MNNTTGPDCMIGNEGGNEMKTTLRSGFREWESLWEFSEDGEGLAFVRKGCSFPNTWEGDGDGTTTVDTPEGVYAIVFHGADTWSAKFFNETGTPEQRSYIRGMLAGVLSALGEKQDERWRQP